MKANAIAELIRDFSGYDTSVTWNVAKHYYVCGSKAMVDGQRRYYAHTFSHYMVSDYPYLVAACYSVMVAAALKEKK
jgi:hypothetical protein